MAILHDITMKLRSGQLSFAPKAEKVVFVGHSLGAVVGNGVATKYPADFDSMIMTGYSNTLLQAVPGLLLTAAIPAQIQNPARFGSLPPGYLAFGSPVGKVNSYYAAEGSYSPDLAAYDFAHQDTLTVGQIITAFSGLQRADQYKGDVLVLTGANDAFFCGPTGTRTLGPQSCGVGADSIPAKSKSFFPSANFDYYLAPNTSHATTLHYSTPDSLKRAHDFLAANEY
jgi:pimeloyl-ACP methyl ester carboxylesterase